MKANSEFHDLMRELWKVMHAELSEEEQDEVYSITFANQVEVHLLMTQPGKFDIISEAGTLLNPNAGLALLELLAINRPPLAVNVDRSSGTVMVWARQNVADADVDSLIALISELVKTVYLAKQAIDCRDASELFGPEVRLESMHVPPRGEGTLAQLRRRN
jgi:hypothetical protein